MTMLWRNATDNICIKGGVTQTFRVLTDVNVSTLKKYRTISVIGGVTVDVSAESQWE